MKNLRMICVGGLLAILILGFAIALAEGISMISSATASGYDAAWHLDVSVVEEDGYAVSTMDTFTLCLALQKIITGGILSFIGGCGILLCIHWIFVLIKSKWF